MWRSRLPKSSADEQRHAGMPKLSASLTKAGLVKSVPKARHENLANLSHLPSHALEAVRSALSGRALVDLDENFEIARSLPHGHVAGVLGCLARSTSSPLFDAYDVPVLAA